MTFKMSLFPVVLLSLSVIILQQQQFTEAATLSLISIPQPENGEVGVCPVQEKRDKVIQNITADIMDIIRDMYAPLIHNCGEGEWYRVAYLNMSDSTQQCPSAWKEYNNSGVRACGRPVSMHFLDVQGRSIYYRTTIQQGVWKSHRLSNWRYRGIFSCKRIN